MTSATTVVPLPPVRPPIATGAGLTHRGRVRERNEDAILTDPSGMLWAVADGMGGHGHGDVAADIVIDCLETIADDESPAEALLSRLTEANRLVRERAALSGAEGMGSTVVAVMVVRAMAWVAWVGDARAYLVRGGRLRLLTRDHTLVQALVDKGELRPEEAERHPESHIVTRAVGGTPEIEIDLLTQPLLPGDRLMLCSDGLPRAIYEPTIEALLAGADGAQAGCERLISEALANGASDNVSAIVVDVREG